MTDKIILSELMQLPESLKLEVLHFIQFLKSKQQEQTSIKVKSGRKPGSAKGKIHMAPDFDAPLEDFKDYM